MPTQKTVILNSLLLQAQEMPGYEIVGVNCRKHAQYSGAIHCLTHEIYANNPIYIKHKWYQGTLEHNINGYPVSVVAKSSDGIKNLCLYWKSNHDKDLKAIKMNALGNDIFEAVIPTHKSGRTINYFIEAENNNGKKLTRPIVAPKHFYNFSIE